MNTLVFTIVDFLHSLFTAIWIGGMVALAFAVLPSIRQSMEMGPESKRLIAEIRGRLSKLVYVAFVVLIATGVLMSNSSPLFEGFFSLSNPYSAVLTVKHILVAAMIVVSLLRSVIIPGRNMPEPKRMRLMMVLLITNIVLGSAVLLTSAYLSAAVREILPVS